MKVEVSRENLPEGGTGDWRAIVRFRGSQKAPVTLIHPDPERGAPWEPFFDVSPNGQWILYTQKTGSGENIAWLYKVELETGRIFRMEEQLDTLAWRYSDTHSSYKMKQLFHRGINDGEWAADGTLRFTLRGTLAAESGKGVTLKLAYDLEKNLLQEIPEKKK